MFSSPHGDFSFSMTKSIVQECFPFVFSSPHGDFSFSITLKQIFMKRTERVFVPSRGFFFFYSVTEYMYCNFDEFSSPHGDFSFSIKFKKFNIVSEEFSSPHGDFSFSMTG